MTKEVILIILIGTMVIMSFVTALFYKLDKEKSKTGQWRTKEKTLLILPWLLGGFGGYIGVYVIRHKTKHWYFVMNNILALIVQVSIIIAIIILM